MASYQKEVKEFIKEVEKRGWRADTTKSGYQLKYKDGIGQVTIHGTPSSPRWKANTWSLIKKAEREAEARERERKGG
jgi:predicted RNA binding protein YcfA (HicA-like mRNA interferase family)